VTAPKYGIRHRRYNKRATQQEPAWRQVARDLKAQGFMPHEIGPKVGKHPNTVGQFFLSDRGPNPIILGDNRSDVSFIKQHKPREIKQVINREAIQAFLAAGGGAKARKQLLKRIGT
jgi:hypothetical protein